MEIITTYLFQILRLGIIMLSILIFIGIKICDARLIDLHVESDADRWQHENLESSNRDKDYQSYTERENRGDSLSEKESREKESYEVDRIN
jgi:hypothetical protein